MRQAEALLQQHSTPGSTGTAFKQYADVHLPPNNGMVNDRILE
jgi:hypothetical protein